ncbi:MAG: DUF3373 family protein, partial [bacterium]
MLRGFLLLLLCLCVSVTVIPATTWAADDEDIEEIFDRLDALELKAAQDKVSFRGDFRVRYDYQKWQVPAYNQFVGMNFSDPMNPLPVYMPVRAQELKNTEAYSARLRLKMDAKLGKDVHFTGRLNMHRGFGAGSVPLFNGFPNTVATAFNSVAIPTDDVLHVERAAFTWEPDYLPLFFTLGRQAATGGPPREISENKVRQGTPGALMIDAQIDGFMLGMRMDKIGLPEGSVFRFCYGTGFESGFGSGGATAGTYVTTYVPDVTDPNNPTLMAMPQMVGELEDSKVAGICGETSIPALPGETLLSFGYFRMLNMTDIPYGVTRGFPNMMSTQSQVVTSTANLGDMDLMGFCFQHSVELSEEFELDWFASYATNKSHPDAGTASLYGFGPLLGNDSEDLTGSAYYLGIRGDLPPTGGKLGFEYNHGDENWFAYIPAGDDVNSKLSTRGNVIEAYYIQPLRDKGLDLRVGIQKYTYDYAFSGWHISPAPIENFDLSAEPFSPYP